MRLRTAWLLGSLGVLWACEGRELTVFDIPASTIETGQGGSEGIAMTQGEAGGAAEIGVSGAFSPVGMMAGRPCADDADCPINAVCDKIGCSATIGMCVLWPPVCTTEPQPVCGCDGMTYWNNCLRLQSGAQLAFDQGCGSTAVSCDVGADCGLPDASCSHVLRPGVMCGRGAGTCWVLPSECPAPGSDPRRFHQCRPHVDGSLPECVDTCTAIASEGTYAPLHRGDPCN